MRVQSSQMRVFSFDHYILRMKFPTGFTHRNLHGFARFPGDIRLLLIKIGYSSSNNSVSYTASVINTFSGGTVKLRANNSNKRRAVAAQTARCRSKVLSIQYVYLRNRLPAVLQLFFFLSTKTMRQPFSGTAERIFMKLSPNDIGGGM